MDKIKRYYEGGFDISAWHSLFEWQQHPEITLKMVVDYFKQEEEENKEDLNKYITFTP